MTRAEEVSWQKFYEETRGMSWEQFHGYEENDK
jgi:hypothetical protein